MRIMGLFRFVGAKLITLGNVLCTITKGNTSIEEAVLRSIQTHPHCETDHLITLSIIYGGMAVMLLSSCLG
jgi:hypothetical protein